MRILLSVFVLFVALELQAATPKVPARKELNALALDSVTAFDKAVKAQDFTAFHKQISKLWQEQITPDQLKSAFQTFIDQQMDLAGAAQVDPVFEPAPSIDDDGVLTLEGDYPTAPNKIRFRLKYMNEKSGWKLLGIKLNVTPAGTSDAKAPTVKEAKTLVRGSLLAFNQAVQAKSFAGFYKQIATLWQNQTTPEKLQALFQPFIDGEVNIAPIAKLEPTFEKGPVIDDDGLLQIQGTYPTSPSKVRFDLAYLNEGADWRLVKINVKVGNPPGAAKDE